MSSIDYIIHSSINSIHILEAYCTLKISQEKWHLDEKHGFQFSVFVLNGDEERSTKQQLKYDSDDIRLNFWMAHHLLQYGGQCNQNVMAEMMS